MDQIKALAEYYDCGDALDSVKMLFDYPTKLEFNAIKVGTTDPTKLVKVKLYKANKPICTIRIMECRLSRKPRPTVFLKV